MALLRNVPKFVHLFAATVVFLAVIRLYLFPLLTASVFSRRPSAPAPAPKPPPPPPPQAPGAAMAGKESSKCDISKGEWVPNPNAPYYTNDTCWAIHEHHNCVKYGRPDDGFMRWRWRPESCDLPVFNPGQFLELVRHKSLAFVGDSVGRNHMQSLLCLLLRVTYAVDASPVQDENFRRYRFPSHNFTVASFWSPFLVRAQEADYPSGLLNLYLDEPDTSWSREIAQFDYVIISAEQPFLRPAMFYENRRPVGCHYCRSPNVTDLTKYYGYRTAFHTALRVFTDDLRSFGGTVFLRTYSPTHFEGGEWDRGGNCLRRRPSRRDEARLDEVAFQMYMTQMEEFRAAEREGRKKGVKLRLLDTTEAMLLRGDGHPGRYGHVAGANVSMYNDCVHWCLPGPIDTWNDFLLHTMKNEGGRLATRRRPGNYRKPRRKETENQI